MQAYPPEKTTVVVTEQPVRYIRLYVHSGTNSQRWALGTNQSVLVIQGVLISGCPCLRVPRNVLAIYVSVE